MGGDLCDETGGPEDPGVYAFSYPLTLPLSLLLCCYFLLKLFDSEIKSKTIKITTAVYVIVALCLELSHSWLYFLRPVTRANTPLVFCATMEFCGWMLAIGSIIGLQQVLLYRLKVIFATSVYEVSQSMMNLWNAFHCVLLTVAIVLFTINSSIMGCKRKMALKGWAVDIGLYPKQVIICAANGKKFYWISFYGVLSAGVCLLIGNAVLGYMYATRIQKALGFGRRKSITDRELKAVKKASVVALASISTTCIALFGFVFNKLLLHVDVLLNVYFLLCQFAFAHHFYDATLAHCEPIVDWLQPKHSVEPIETTHTL